MFLAFELYRLSCRQFLWYLRNTRLVGRSLCRIISCNVNAFSCRYKPFLNFQHSLPTRVSRQVPSAGAPPHLSVVSWGDRHQIVLCLRDGDVPAAWEVGSAAAGRERCVGCLQVWCSGCWSAYNIRTDLMKFGCASAGRCVEGLSGVVQIVETWSTEDLQISLVLHVSGALSSLDDLAGRLS